MDARTVRLRQAFGLEQFRPWQREAIDALLDRERRVVVVAPTGGGKSLCYQYPAVELEGTTVVISPLIALMDDQVRSLEQRGIAATYLASNLDLDELRERSRRLLRGEYKLVYVSPERVAHPLALETLRRLEPPLVAIDEAHCISQWGHDFRPDYLRLGELVQTLAPKHLLACTATATPVVREEIVSRLGLRAQSSRLVLRGFARPNLHLEAVETDTQRARRSHLLEALGRSIGAKGATKGAAIVYAATRRATEETAAWLAEQGYQAAAYHAGLPAERRAVVGAAFAAGELEIVVATNAFGMGIDRPDIRAVVHIQAPGSIEAYYQEVGRAGRDGQPALGLLITGTADIGLRRRLVELGTPGGDGPSSEEVERQWGLYLGLLRYVEAGSCRHDFILRYFGDEQETLGGCGHCDRCEELAEASNPVERTVDEDDALIVRKALSGVARAHRKFGLTAVADMLKGKTTEKLRRMGLDQLSTYGLLAERELAWILALLRRLISAGLVAITADSYPLVMLTKAGVSVMKGESPVRVLPPPEIKAAPKGNRARARERRSGERGAADRAALVAESDRELFEALRAVRLEEAKSRGVPAYVVCHDRTLAEIAERRPANVEELSRVHGMGPARLEVLADVFLPVVAERG